MFWFCSLVITEILKTYFYSILLHTDTPLCKCSHQSYHTKIASGSVKVEELYFFKMGILEIYITYHEQDKLLTTKIELSAEVLKV